MKTVYLIGCGAKKLNVTSLSKDIYQGELFKKAYKYASSQNPDYIFILSAKHRLLELDKIIEPYNMTLNRMSNKQVKEWSAQVLEDIKDKGLSIENDKFVFLAGKRYYEGLIGERGIKNYYLPYQGLKGIGYILQFLNNSINNEKKQSI